MTWHARLQLLCRQNAGRPPLPSALGKTPNLLRAAPCLPPSTSQPRPRRKSRGAGGLDSLRASEDRRTSKRSHLRCGVLEGAASLAHPRAARMCGQAGPETIRHVMFSIPACLNPLTERMSVGGTAGIGGWGGARTSSAEGSGAAGSWTDRDLDTRRREGEAWVTGGKGTRDRMDGGPEPAAGAGGGIVAIQSRALPALAFR